MDRRQQVDVLVIGGGPAGLSAALWLGRHRLRTVVADRGEPRNRGVVAGHGYLGFDGAPPEELLRRGREELRGYDEVQLAPCGVRTLHRVPGGFVAELDDRTLHTRAVVLATGVVDVLPPLDGLHERYGRGVFVCPLCDGYEVQGQKVAVLGAGGAAGEFADELLQWASDVVVVPLGEERPGGEVPSSVRVMDVEAVAIRGDDEVEGLVLRDGTEVDCEAIFLRSDTVAVADLAEHLGCERNDEGLILTDEDGETSVPGVWAAGDCTPGPPLVQIAAAEGVRVGLSCARALLS